MSLDERLRSDLGRVPTSAVDVDASLQAVTRQGIRQRRRRLVVPAVVVSAVLATLALVGLRHHGESSLDTVNSPAVPTTASAAPSTGVAPSTTAGPTSTAPRPGSAPTSSAPTGPAASSTVPPTPTPAPTTTAVPARPASVPVDLTFTGIANGHVTSATVAPAGIVLGPHNSSDATPACTNALQHQDGATGATFGIIGTVGGRPFLLSYSVGDVNDVTGGLAEGVLIFGQPGFDYNTALSYDPTKVVVDADRLGGQIDADVHSSTAVVGHVSGHFRCSS